MDDNQQPVIDEQEARRLAEQEANDLSEQEQIRRDKLSKLAQAGNDPFTITNFDVTGHTTELVTTFEADETAFEGKAVSVAGRMMSRRIMGKASFAHILDRDGQMQIYLRRDDVGDDSYAAFKDMDIGDIVGVTGEMFRTKTGEATLRAHSISLLTKSLRPLPEKWHGLKDPELRYRQRYVDLIVNPDVRKTFRTRSIVMNAVREFLNGRGFMEVETPTLTTLAGGASARPFVTHHNTLDIDMYMRISLELYLKRLIVGGFERVYEMGRVFRNEGMDVRHNPEFTLLELYQAYTDYNGMMEIVEQMFAFVAQRATGSTKVVYQGVELDFTPPWRRLTMNDAVKEFVGVDILGCENDEQAREIGRKLGLEVKPNDPKGRVLATAFDEKCEEHLIQPTFVTDYPVEISPLAKRSPKNPAITERFEGFVFAREACNAFSELNDPIDQRSRFEDQMRQRADGDDEAMVIDEDFLAALEYGMPPTGGLGVGIDRMIMFMTDAASIRDVLLFPTMKPREN